MDRRHTTEDYYGENKNHIIKNTAKPVYEESEIVANTENSELSKISKKGKSEDNIIEELRKIALIYNPKHGDDLYPLEVLGVYHIVLDDIPAWWNFTKYGNPENFIDNQIIEWANKTDLAAFALKIREVLQSDELVRTAFQLRMNYAWLLKEEIDTIHIATKRAGYLAFTDMLDSEGNYIGDLQSSIDLDDEDLDKLADDFYKNKKKINEKKVGTPVEIRNRIKQVMDSAGIEMNLDVNQVYNELKKFNSTNHEAGLIGRIAYLIFINEMKPNDKQIRYNKTKIQNPERFG